MTVILIILFVVKHFSRNSVAFQIFSIMKLSLLIKMFFEFINNFIRNG
jgi:hypothetical protein